MKSKKQIIELALKFSQNMIDKIQASIDAGNLSSEDLESAQEIISEFNKLKGEIDEEFSTETKAFSAQCTERFSSNEVSKCEPTESIMWGFALLRKLVPNCIEDTELCKLVEEMAIKEGLECVYQPVYNRAVALKYPELKVDSLIQEYNDLIKELVNNYKSFIDDVKSMEVTPENFIEFFQMHKESPNPSSVEGQNEGEIKQFSAESGMELVKSGLKFVKEIIKRMKSAEEPNEDDIELYESAVNSLDTFLNRVKKFSSGFTKESFSKVMEGISSLNNGEDIKLFTHTFSNEGFVELMNSLSESYKINFIDEVDGYVDTFELSNDKGDNIKMKVYFNEGESSVSKVTLTDLNGMESDFDISEVLSVVGSFIEPTPDQIVEEKMEESVDNSTEVAPEAVSETIETQESSEITEVAPGSELLEDEDDKSEQEIIAEIREDF